MARQKRYRYLVYLTSRFLAWLLYLLPRSWAYAVARFMGRFAYRFITRERMKTIEHLRQAYGGEKNQIEVVQIGQKVFENLCLTAAEVLQFQKWNRESILEHIRGQEAYDVYDVLLKEGKGLISLTAHLGNWELLAAVFGLRGYRGAVLARRIYYEPYNRWVVGIRESFQVPTLYRDQSAGEVLERLAKNEIIGMLPDQDVRGGRGGIFVDFFGRPCFTSTAPVRLSLASGAPMVCSFLVREGEDRFRVAVGEVIRPQAADDRREAVRHYTELWMKEMEKMVRLYPEQWGWMHDRWHTQPEALRPVRQEETVSL
ncbi:MAG: lysophospholipid acyltransferase family protein [candidate division Zixibacteria bacterium]|nr:lysophospholipid acyltransferase family protein [candidate division Zixibacteria bacterium]